MLFKRIAAIAGLTSCLILLGTTDAELQAQKIGHTNFELIVYNLPRFKDVETQIKTHEKQLLSQLEIKKQYLQTKLQEYQEKEAKMTATEKESQQKDLLKLKEEIEKFQREAEQSLQTKKDELLQPLFLEAKKAIDAVAAAEGYSIILNNPQSQAGISGIVLYAPAGADITDKVGAKLGITIKNPNKKQ